MLSRVWDCLMPGVSWVTSCSGQSATHCSSCSHCSFPQHGVIGMKLHAPSLNESEVHVLKSLHSCCTMVCVSSASFWPPPTLPFEVEETQTIVQQECNDF